MMDRRDWDQASLFYDFNLDEVIPPARVIDANICCAPAFALAKIPFDQISYWRA
jgi:hypothetical protein